MPILKRTRRSRRDIQGRSSGRPFSRAPGHRKAQVAAPGRLREEPIRSAAELSQTIANAIPALIAYVGRQQRFLFHNRAYENWFGADAADIRGRRLRDVFGEEVYKKMRPFVEKALGGESVDTEVEGAFKIGKRWVRTDFVPDRARDGAVRGVVALLTDVTRIKTSEEALRRSETELKAARDQLTRQAEDLGRVVAQRTSRLTQVNEELESFTYSASHDLRAPLRKVAGFIQAVTELNDGRLDDESMGYLSKARAAMVGMNELIDDMLALAGVVQRELHHEEVDLAALAAEILEELRKTEPGRRVEIRIKPRMLVRGDTHVLRIALRNLVDNAWKFTRLRPDARIRVGSITREGKPIFFVRDNGAGFDMTYVGKIFKPFERLHRMEDFPGTGVGLAIVKRAVQRHGGRVWARSSPGRGATFFFTLSETTGQ